MLSAPAEPASPHPVTPSCKSNAGPSLLRPAHFDWATVERATKQGLWPDTISTDWNVMSKTTGVIDFPNVMSKFIMFGMPLSQIIACATVNAARVFPSFDDRGTLNVGAPADVAIRELREGTFEFLDDYKGTRTGHQRLFPAGTVWRASRCRALNLIVRLYKTSVVSFTR